jgi:hypothetical protein
MESLIKLLVLSRETSLSTLVNTFGDFQLLFSTVTDARQAFLRKTAIQTDACRRITALVSNGCGEVMFFGSSTT